mmetsp:Transcript_34998/g.40443  ORF Transcript_34998/g.40443 Transcript_34998/m.40443 type:complete len:90 (-) Transcript_34998:65-334(-)
MMRKESESLEQTPRLHRKKTLFLESTNREFESNAFLHESPITHTLDHITKTLTIENLKGLFTSVESSSSVLSIYDVLELYHVLFQNLEL